MVFRLDGQENVTPAGPGTAIHEMVSAADGLGRPSSLAGAHLRGFGRSVSDHQGVAVRQTADEGD